MCTTAVREALGKRSKEGNMARQGFTVSSGAPLDVLELALPRMVESSLAGSCARVRNRLLGRSRLHARDGGLRWARGWTDDGRHVAVRNVHVGACLGQRVDGMRLVGEHRRNEGSAAKQIGSVNVARLRSHERLDGGHIAHAASGVREGRAAMHIARARVRAELE